MVHAPAAAGRRLLAALVALLLAAIVCGWPFPAEAAGDEAAAPSSWPLFLAAAIQVAVALVVGGYQTTRTRLIALADKRLDEAELRQASRHDATAQALRELKRDLDERLDRLATRQREMDRLLATTREDFAKKAEVEAVRQEMGILRSRVDEAVATTHKILAILAPRENHRA